MPDYLLLLHFYLYGEENHIKVPASINNFIINLSLTAIPDSHDMNSRFHQTRLSVEIYDEHKTMFGLPNERKTVMNELTIIFHGNQLYQNSKLFQYLCLWSMMFWL